jgi:hypothetical protein
MDHIMCLDAGAGELENLVSGNKSMIIRGSDFEYPPFGSMHEGDVLYFTNGPGTGEVKARGVVSSVFNSGRLSIEESFETIIRNQDKLQLPDKLFYRWAGKRYLLLVGLNCVEMIEPYMINRSEITSLDDWLPASSIAE